MTAYIVFILDTKKFAIKLEQFPMILRPEEYLQSSRNGSITNEPKYVLDNEQIKIIEIKRSGQVMQYLNNENTRLLVGEYKNRLHGFFVDLVKEIINVNDHEIVEFFDPELNSTYQEVNFNDEHIPILDVITEQPNLNENNQ